MEQHFSYTSPLGNLLIETSQEQIVAISFTDKLTPTEIQTELQKQTVLQLDEYFEGERLEFNLPLSPIGTDFQKKVWSKLIEIPYGSMISYLDLAIRLGDKKLIRAVGGANSKNPLAIVIPCHRVIGANNKLVGYAGGIWRKKWLLEHELKFTPTKRTLF